MEEKKVKEYKVPPVVVIITIIVLGALMALPQVLRIVMPGEEEEVFEDEYISLNCLKTIDSGIYSSIGVNTLYYNKDMVTLTIVYNINPNGGSETVSTLLPEGNDIPFVYDGVEIVENETSKTYKVSNNILLTLNNQYLTNLSNPLDEQKIKIEADGYICNQITG